MDTKVRSTILVNSAATTTNKYNNDNNDKNEH